MGDTQDIPKRGNSTVLFPVIGLFRKEPDSPPQAVWHLAVGRRIISPKSFYCRDEQIDLQMYGVASLCWKYHPAPAESSGNTVAIGPGAITSSSALIEKLIKALPLITHLLC